ncbi:hypothetical protein [Winogradskyella sp.]|uniref:hypothetical protein n=1 Tax=Winogradskyella sp. TaxID=1883156 RepID=UPI003BAD0724
MNKQLKKPSKMSWKYVMGELLLIVFGILIALYINNLNESRKLKDFENKIVSEIEKSLTSDYDFHITSRITRAEQIIQSSETVLEFLDGKIKYNDSLEIHFWRISWIVIFEPKSIPFETLKSKGIELISNEDIRKSLLELYDYTYPRINYFTESFNNWSTNRVEPYCIKNFAINKGDRGKAYKPIDIDQIKNSIEYRNLVFEKMTKTNRLLGRMNRAKDNVGDLLMQLKKQKL